MKKIIYLAVFLGGLTVARAQENFAPNALSIGVQPGYG